jgi:hypothetical protein
VKTLSTIIIFYQKSDKVQQSAPSRNISSIFPAFSGLKIQVKLLVIDSITRRPTARIQETQPQALHTEYRASRYSDESFRERAILRGKLAQCKEFLQLKSNRQEQLLEALLVELHLMLEPILRALMRESLNKNSFYLSLSLQ